MKKNKGLIVLCGVLLLMLIGVTGVLQGRVQDLEAKVNQAKRANLDLETKVGEKKAALENPPVVLTEEEQTAIVNSAADLGNKVRDIQNRVMAGDMNALGELDACFDASDKNAKTQWYYGQTPGTWTFVTDGTFTGEQRNVLWLCRGGDGTLLAYATAVYDATSNTFSDTDFQMSLTGAGSVASSNDCEDPASVDVGDVNSLAEQMKNVTPVDGGELSEEDEMDVRRAQEALRQQMTNGGNSDED